MIGVLVGFLLGVVALVAVIGFALWYSDVRRIRRRVRREVQAAAEQEARQALIDELEAHYAAAEASFVPEQHFGPYVIRPRGWRASIPLLRP